MLNRNDIVITARNYVGTPWRHQGRNPAVGIDCVGLLVLVARDLGISDYDYKGYTRRATGWEFMSHFENNMNRKPVKNYMPGDVLVFRDGSYPCHCGIVAERRGVVTFIHSSASLRKTWEEDLTNEWPGKIVACFEFRGIDNG